MATSATGGNCVQSLAHVGHAPDPVLVPLVDPVAPVEPLALAPVVVAPTGAPVAPVEPVALAPVAAAVPEQLEPPVPQLVELPVELDVPHARMVLKAVKATESVAPNRRLIVPCVERRHANCKRRLRVGGPRASRDREGAP